MNRLRILKQRASRSGVAVVRSQGQWLVANQYGCDGPFSRRQAIQLAARWAMPFPKLVFLISQPGQPAQRSPREV